VGVLAVLLCLCAGAGIWGSRYLIKTYTQIQDVENAHSIVPKLPVRDRESDASDGDQQTGDIDFEALQEQNPDIYGWIYIPDTHVNYPVCQSAEANDYYLSHGADGSESELGAIYSEAQFNHADFEDRVVVLYGHSGYAETMFSKLHEYALREYMDAHDKIYLYVPGKVYTYQVFSAFAAGERHIMDAFDLSSDEGMASFISYLLDPQTVGAQVRESEVGTRDRLLVLSTCTSGLLESQGRFLVCGVLIDEQQTS
jgi:sortase B